ncbi:MAG: hypothetical protein V3T72_13345, partial [Thermoanaerobaculia bacterium]
PLPADRSAIERQWRELELELLSSFGGEGFDLLERVMTAKRGLHGRTLVLDWADSTVKMFDDAGRLEQRYPAHPAAEDGSRWRPVDFAVADSGDVWIADRGAPRVRVFDAAGNRRRTLGLRSIPDRIVLAADGGFTVLTLDAGSHLFESYGPDGEFRQRFGRLLAGDLQEPLLLGGTMSADPEGALVFAPAYLGVLASYDREGRLRFLVETVGGESRDLPRVLATSNGRRLEPGTPLRSLAVQVVDDLIYVLSERESTASKSRILDVYSNQDGAYRHSIRLPDGPRDFLVDGEFLVTVHRDRVQRWRLASICTSCAPPPEALAEGQLANVSRQSLERSIELAPGIGAVHQPVTTHSAAAQSFYDQGLAYLASFDWVRSARSFHQASREDPSLAAARLGLARSYLGLESAELARGHARAAAELAERGGSGAHEKDWVALGELQMEAVLADRAGVEEQHQVYLRAIESYIDRYPDDVHALVLRGNADPRPDAWGQAGRQGSLAWYLRALELAPNHFPAEHFLAHSLENLGRYREARDHARRYAELAPRIPHAHHMVAHVSPRLGEWDETLESLAAADRLHRQSFETGEIEPREDWHYGHNLRLLAAVHLLLGQRQRAGDLYRACFELPYRGRRAGFYCQPWVSFLLLEGRFEEALAAARSCGRRDSELGRLLAAALAGEALLALDRGDDARRALTDARRRQRSLSRRLRQDSSERSVAFAAQLAVRVLEAKIELDVDPDRGKALLREIVEAAGSGHSFDAWASGSLRIAEITAHLARRGHQHLVAELAEIDWRPPPPAVAATGVTGRHCS